MRLYLIRHATAVDAASSDAHRELTKTGEEESRIIGRALLQLNVQPAVILTSPLRRARQTAALIATEMKVKSEITLEELANESSTPQLIRALKRFDQADELLLVGHMPSLADHLAALIGARGAVGLGFGKGSVACVVTESVRDGAGTLHWLMRQTQLAHVSGRAQS